MAVDVIKEYLVGIGFNLNEESFQETQEKLTNTGEKIKEFNKGNKKSFLEGNEGLKEFIQLLKKSNTVNNMFPGLQDAFNGAISIVKKIKKLNLDLNNSKKNKVKSENNKIISKTDYKPKNKIKKSPKTKEYKGNDNAIKFKPKARSNDRLKDLMQDVSEAKKNILPFGQALGEGLIKVKDKAKLLAENGGKSLKAFSIKGILSFSKIVLAIVAAVLAVKELIGHLKKMANEDIKNEKLSRQLWTTKQNAKEINDALGTLGANMQDLYLSPTLLKQFNQLRKDSKELGLPPDYEKNIKVVQGLGLEFKRLKQLGKLSMQWIGNYILKYLAGPLAEFKKKLSNFNEKFKKAIPYIGKFVGTILGSILRILLLIFRVLEPIFSIVSKIISFIIGLIEKIPGPIKKILKLIIAITAVIMAGPVGAIVLLIALIDDFFTFLRGGKSIIGSVFGFFREKGLDAMRSIKSKFEDLKESLKQKIKENGWDEYYNNALKCFEGIRKKAQEVWADIREWSKGVWDKTKDFFKGEKGVEMKNSVQHYNKNIASKPNVPPSYATNNKVSNSTNTSNSNNKIANNVEIKVSSNDPKGAANAIGSKIKGINTRNLQGAF